MEYNFDEKVTKYFEVENAKFSEYLQARTDLREEVGVVELVGNYSGIMAKTFSVILQEYHEELMKQLPSIIKGYGESKLKEMLNIKQDEENMKIFRGDFIIPSNNS